jgi:glycosyltransferase involved in cell wall biosynthesis
MKLRDKKLVVASGGSELPFLQSLAQGFDNIIFTGWLEESTLRTLIGKAIATLYLPINEDFGMSPVESMAAGKPVIGVAEGGLLETVRHGETGTLLLVPLSLESLIDAILQMTPRQARQMREACSHRAALFSREIFRDKMLSVVGRG